ncbi:MAG: isoprenylcysteine carboxylmethyltransferase family protein [Chloroflexi bacterium]|nr:isoprenylcysteine carboxylmethyltransferase family protein [Chloroflexota bacterium]
MAGPRVRPHALRLARALAIHLGLLWLGWGDLIGLLSEPARLAFVVVLILSLAVETSIVQHTVARDEVVAERVRLASLYWLWLLLLCLLPYADRRDLLTLPEGGVRLLGVALVTTGFALRFTAVLTLGRQFSTGVGLQDQHRLVRSGIYRWVRHPAYLAMLLTFSGAPLVFRSVPGLAYAVLMLFVLRARIAAEEALLAREFGVEYDAYSKQTWRLLPGIW